MPLVVDGVDDFAIIANESNFDFTINDEFSVDILFFPDDLDRTEALVSKLSTSLRGWEVVKLADALGNVFRFQLLTDGGNLILVDSSVRAVNGWQRITVTKSTGTTSAALKIYIDGEDVSTNRTDVGSVADITNSDQVKIGRRAGSPGGVGGEIPAEGLIDEVSIRDAELSLNQVLAHYKPKIKHTPLFIQPTSLVTYLPLDDGKDGSSADGVTLKDLSGNGNTALGDNGPNDSGMLFRGENNLTYPGGAIFARTTAQVIVIPPSANNPRGSRLKTVSEMTNRLAAVNEMHNRLKVL